MADAQDVMDAASGSAEDLEKNAKGAGKGMAVSYTHLDVYKRQAMRKAADLPVD